MDWTLYEEATGEDNRPMHSEERPWGQYIVTVEDMYGEPLFPLHRVFNTLKETENYLSMLEKKHFATVDNPDQWGSIVDRCFCVHVEIYYGRKQTDESGLAEDDSGLKTTCPAFGGFQDPPPEPSRPVDGEVEGGGVHLGACHDRPVDPPGGDDGTHTLPHGQKGGDDPGY